MKRILAILAATLTTLLLVGQIAHAEGKTHYIAFHVDQADPKVQNMALNNAVNVTKYYESQGDKVVIEMVAYGPGLTMYLKGKSTVSDRISVMSLEMENLSFSACGNTHRKMSKKAGKELALLDEATMVTSGVVRLVDLQEQGYAYVRP